MMYLLKKIEARKWEIGMFCIIIAIGIFFRTYHFHDWLRFNADQSRDATVVSNVIDGKESVPLLGPKAGGTNFRVGPVFYYFQIAGAKLFGNYPDKMAYPDLFFSILTIPLLFFFLRKYFDIKTSLLLVALFSVSLYAIKYSRFAWNPNSLPFWSILLLYGLHGIMIAKENIWKWWALMTGVALGIGVQLHSLSLLLFPLMTLCVFGYLLFKRKQNIWKSILVICFAAVLLNIPQIVSEMKTGGENTAAFFGGVGTKEKKGDGIIANTMKDVVCFSQAHTYILSSYDSSDTCEVKSIMRGWNIPAFIAGLVTFVGGFVLAIRSLRREEDAAKKYFLGLFIASVTLTFLILVLVANEISMRFFLVIVFMPFVFLGIWLNYLSEKFPKIGSIGAWSIGIILIVMNLFSVTNSFSTYASYFTDSDAGMDNVLLKEVELSAAYILAHSGGAKTVAVTGDAKYLFKALKSMRYFTEKSGTKLVEKGKKTDPAIPVFLVENTKNKDLLLKNNSRISDYESFGRFTIFSLRNE